MWTEFDVRWEFITRLYGSVPGQSSMIQDWLKARAPRTRPPQGKSLDEIAQEVYETIAAAPQDEEAEEKPLIFQRVPAVVDGQPVQQLAVRVATIRAHLKDCAYQVQTYIAGAIEGEKSFSVRLRNALYWPPAEYPRFQGTPFVLLTRTDGQPVLEADGVQEKAIHMNTAQGPRSALKAIEFIEGAAMNFTLSVLHQPPRQVRVKTDGKWGLRAVPGRLVVNEADITTLMEYGGYHGYGGERSEDGGRYVFKITERTTDRRTDKHDGEHPESAGHR